MSDPRALGKCKGIQQHRGSPAEESLARIPRGLHSILQIGLSSHRVVTKQASGSDKLGIAAPQ